ncbi:integrase, catalytic region, zinc finger, CCHC-type containing protein [Tanacetum coccineum]
MVSSHPVFPPLTGCDIKHSVLNANSELICATCHECMFNAIHDLCVSDYLNDLHARVKSKSVKSRYAKSKKKKMWKPTGKVYTNVGCSWRPTERTFTIDGNMCPLTRIISTKVVPLRKSISTTPVKQTQPSSNKYGKLKDIKNVGSSSKSKAVSSKISNHSEPMQNWGSNVSTALSSSRVNFSKFLGTVRFGIDQIVKIMGYSDYQLGNVTISRVYYVEGLGHNLFSVGLILSRDTNLYNISLDDMLKSSPICLLSKAFKTKSWLCNRRLSYLNFGTLNQLAKKGLVQGLPKLKFKKDHLSSVCSLGKMEAARTMLIFSKAPLYLWAEAVSTACYTQNRSLIRLRYNKTPYELMHEKKPDLSFLHVFGSLCYPTNDSEDLEGLPNLQQKNQRIHVTFDELTAIASDHFSSGHAPQLMTYGTFSSPKLKFINKGDVYQVYGKPILDTLITNEIKISEAYKTFFGISNGLIPTKKGRDEAEGELKNRPTGRKNRTPRAVFIQEPISFPVKKTQESSGKRKGVGLRPEVPDELTKKSADSDEEARISPEGSTDDETFLFEDKEENLEDIPWVSTDDDESENDDEEDDMSIDIKKTDNERMDTDVEDQVKGVAEMNIAKEAEEENTKRVEEQKDDEELKADEEQKGDDQAGDEQLVIPISTTQKEMPSLLQSTSSHFVSSNFGNQFINSPNASLISTILENAVAEINSLLDIQINQDVPNIQFTALEQAVKELKQADHFAVVLASIKSQVPSVVENYLGTESVQANVINEVKNFLPKFLLQEVKESLEKTSPSLGQSSSQGQSAIQATKSLFEYELKNILYEKMHKIQSHRTHDTHQELYDALMWSMLLDEATTKEGDKPDKVLKKRDREDDQNEDPSAGSNQGKKTQKRRVNESESSKKTSTTTESSKGKSLARTYKSGKSMTAKESLEEPVFDIASNDVEKTFDDKVGDVGQPPHTDSDKTQADDSLKILKKDWFKDSPKPELLDLDWNTVKTINDAPEQPWFNEMVQAEKPPLMFDELMSTLIDFSAYAMNRLKLNKITREDLVGPVFKLLKGTCKSCVELEYNMEECYHALTYQIDWANLKGYKSPIDMSKPLPLQDKSGRLLIPIEFFFNNDLEYLRAGNKERSYSSSITKTSARRYTLEGIEYMIPTLWSPVLTAYDKYVALEI